MTHTDPTAAALLRAILLHPADDTARLVLADWLDEHGEHERAEFIRVQCELERSQRGDLPITEGLPLFARQRKLLTDARRGEWSGIKCPMCGGDGKGLGTGSRHSNPCPRCAGTGFAPVEFRRGFVFRVRCRMGDALRPAGEYFEDWTLTPWARGVLAAHPVTQWEIVDIDDNPPGRDSLMIWLGIQYAESGGRLADNEPFPRCVGRVARRLAGLPATGTIAG